MVRNYFHLVPRLREIYCDVSRDEIERYLYKYGEFDRCFPVSMADDDGVDVDFEVRVIFQRSGQRKDQLAVAVLLHDTRITGIDWEGRFHEGNSERRSGWHRHLWDARERSAEKRKIALEGFDSSFSDVSGFVLRATEELGLVLSGKDYGDPQEHMQWA